MRQINALWPAKPRYCQEVSKLVVIPVKQFPLKTRIFRLLCISCLLALLGCKHPLAIVGQGDILELNGTSRGCTLEQFQASSLACTQNNVTTAYNVRYEAVPRAGWRFDHWEGPCEKDGTNPCVINVAENWVKRVDSKWPNTTVPATKAVFVRSSGATITTEYWASSFGVDYIFPYSSFLNAKLKNNGTYKYSTLLESTRTVFDSGRGYYRREADGLLSASSTSSDYSAAGASTSNRDFIAIADIQSSDYEISIAYLTRTLQGATKSDIAGTYYCGTLTTDPSATFARLTLNSAGSGTLQVIEHTTGDRTITNVSYNLYSDGVLELAYGGIRLISSFLASGDVIVGTQVQSFAQGIGICIRESSGKRNSDVVGSYYGVYADAQPYTAVTELIARSNGTFTENVLHGAYGDSNYRLASGAFALSSNGRVAYSGAKGMVSPDGRIGFSVNAGLFSNPYLVIYIRQTE